MFFIPVIKFENDISFWFISLSLYASFSIFWDWISKYCPVSISFSLDINASIFLYIVSNSLWLKNEIISFKNLYLFSSLILIFWLLFFLSFELIESLIELFISFSSSSFIIFNLDCWYDLRNLTKLGIKNKASLIPFIASSLFFNIKYFSSLSLWLSLLCNNLVIYISISLKQNKLSLIKENKSGFSFSSSIFSCLSIISDSFVNGCRILLLNSLHPPTVLHENKENKEP